MALLTPVCTTLLTPVCTTILTQVHTRQYRQQKKQDNTNTSTHKSIKGGPSTTFKVKVLFLNISAQQDLNFKILQLNPIIFRVLWGVGT